MIFQYLDIIHFLNLYQRNFQLSKGPFRTVEDYIKAIDLRPQLNESGYAFLVNNGLDKMTVNELVDSLTLGTYGQQVTKLHAIMTMIALAGHGSSVQGGNYQIFGKYTIKSIEFYILSALTFRKHDQSKFSKVKYESNGDKNQQRQTKW